MTVESWVLSPNSAMGKLVKEVEKDTVRGRQRRACFFFFRNECPDRCSDERYAKDSVGDFAAQRITNPVAKHAGNDVAEQRGEKDAKQDRHGPAKLRQQAQRQNLGFVAHLIGGNNAKRRVVMLPRYSPRVRIKRAPSCLRRLPAYRAALRCASARCTSPYDRRVTMSRS